MDVKAMRRETGLNQHDFWWPIGVTQSGGSRYERGRFMPRPVRDLLNLVYVEKVDVEKITGSDQLVAEYLKREHPETYLAILKKAKESMKEAKRGNDKGAA